jgi:hypothetical protein
MCVTNISANRIQIIERLRIVPTPTPTIRVELGVVFGTPDVEKYRLRRPTRTVSF